MRSQVYPILQTRVGLGYIGRKWSPPVGRAEPMESTCTLQNEGSYIQTLNKSLGKIKSAIFIFY